MFNFRCDNEFSICVSQRICYQNKLCGLNMNMQPYIYCKSSKQLHPCCTAHESQAQNSLKVYVTNIDKPIDLVRMPAMTTTQ